MVRHVTPLAGEESPTEPFDLTVGLGVISGGEVVGRAEDAPYVLK